MRGGKASYDGALALLRRAKELADYPVLTKSGIIVGLGERNDEVVETMRDLRAHGVDVVTIGQYLQPSAKHATIDRWVHPDEFRWFREQGEALGFGSVFSGPLVRSSYRADEQRHAAATGRGASRTERTSRAARAVAASQRRSRRRRRLAAAIRAPITLTRAPQRRARSRSRSPFELDLPELQCGDPRRARRSTRRRLPARDDRCPAARSRPPMSSWTGKRAAVGRRRLGSQLIVGITRSRAGIQLRRDRAWERLTVVVGDERRASATRRRAGDVRRSRRTIDRARIGEAPAPKLR